MKSEAIEREKEDRMVSETEGKVSMDGNDELIKEMHARYILLLMKVSVIL
jgi:hypothetical protein